MIIPAITATARSSSTVMMVTTTKTNASGRGIYLIRLSEENSKVPILTMNMIPTSTATGIAAITSEKLTTSMISKTAAVNEESLPRPPDVKLMTDCPIIAQPAIPPKSPDVLFPTPNAIHSLLPEPRLPPISSRTESVNNDSISPTSATITATGRMIFIDSHVKSSPYGITKEGNETLERSAREPTVFVSIPPK